MGKTRHHRQTVSVDAGVALNDWLEAKESAQIDARSISKNRPHHGSVHVHKQKQDKKKKKEEKDAIF